MEIKISTRQILRILYILSWVIFIGICIEAGGFIVAAIFTLAKPEVVKNLWLLQVADLSALYAYDHGNFFVITLIMSIVAVMKAVLFYLIITILHDKKVNMSQPFSRELGRFIFNISYLSFLIGIFCSWGSKYSEWLIKQGVKMPDIQYLHLGGADVWLFMGIILFIIAQIFKRGIEIQSENELTI